MRVTFGGIERRAAGKKLLERSPQTARLGRRNGDAGHRGALQKGCPVLRQEIQLVRHGRDGLISARHTDIRQFFRRIGGTSGKWGEASAPEEVRRSLSLSQCKP